MTHRSTQGLHTFSDVRYTDRCLCPTCREWFNSIAALDMHRRNGACLSIGAMQQKGMAISAAGFWITEPMAQEASAVRQGASNGVDPS